MINGSRVKRIRQTEKQFDAERERESSHINDVET